MRNIGGYQLLGLLGRGGMGSVYKVMDSGQGRLMAMKVLHPSQIMRDVLGIKELKNRFLKEAEVMRSLKHRHVAGVLEVGEHRGLPYMVQEYLCINLGLLIGESARIELPTRPLSPLRALRITSQILDCLSGLHESGLVHRDIKPENIMLSREGDVKIIDFGLSRFAGEKEHNPVGMIVGSPYYAAPEQVDNPEKADERSDVYSAGVVLHRMVTGNLPDISGLEISKHPLLGPRWDSLLKTALASNPVNRFPHAKAMNEKLQELRLDWEKRQEQVCALSLDKNKSPAGKDLPARNRPAHTGRSDLLYFKNLNSLMQPEVYVDNNFQETDEGILDHATGLMWAGDLSAVQVNYDQAQEYLWTINQNASYKQTCPWRLPTIDELTTLLEPRQSLEDFCGPDLWRLKDSPWLWSADTQTKTKAWIVDMDQGAVLAGDRMCRFHVLSVREHQAHSGNVKTTCWSLRQI